MRRYWTFYWPLALTGLAMLLGAQFKNGVLARYPDAKMELAAFALASSTFAFLHACLIFVPHMANVLARSRGSHRVCFRFTLTMGGILSLPLLFLGFTGPGTRAIAALYHLDGAPLLSVIAYLRMLTPLMLVDGLRNYYMGLLVQAKRTRIVTVINVAGVLVTIGLLVLGRRMGCPAVTTLTGAMVVSAALHLLLVFTTCVRGGEPGATTPDAPEVKLADVFHFFWPVATTSVMFALSRPVMYVFVNRMADGLAAIAALRVAFDFAMLFHNPANQFRHFFATYGGEDPRGTRRFMTRVMLCLFGLMVVTVYTPLAAWILHRLMGIPGDLVVRAIPALKVLCLTPLVITTRNYFHGHLMVRRQTGGMAVGAVARVMSIAAGSYVLFRMGRLNHTACAALLVMGFAAEAVVSSLFVRRLSRTP